MRHPLRTLLLAALLAMLPIARTSGAGTLGVDPTSRIIVSSRLYVAFDPYYPEVIRTMVFKDWDPNTDLSTDGSSNSEFWGQTYRNGSDPGYIVPYETVLGTWQVAQQDSHSAQIVITSQSLNQPVIVTTYRFYADQPYFLVDRSIQFAGAPDTSAYQAYLARFAFNDIYHALRWRTPSGTLIQRGFCIEPCVENDWDGRWLQQVQMSGRTGLSMAQIYPSSMPSGSTIARGYGPYTASGWVNPQAPAGLHNGNEGTHLMIAFSLQPDSVAAIDSLWSYYNGGHFVTAAPPPSPATTLRFAVSPNPAHGLQRFDWSAPRAGRVTLDVLDVAGRRIARLLDGEQVAGEHALVWNGVDVNGAMTGPGLYFARLVTPDGVRTARWVRAD